MAFCTDSIRTVPSGLSPWANGLGKRTQSPIAEIAGSGVARNASTRTPSSAGSPASAASSRFGSTPMPIRMKSAGSSLPSPRVMPVARPSRPVIAVTPAPNAKRTPIASWALRKNCAISGETARAIGRSAASTTVTDRPRAAATAANSSPMKPAPITTIALASPSAVRSASASARPRNWRTFGKSAPGTGSGRLRAPVARTRWS